MLYSLQSSCHFILSQLSQFYSLPRLHDTSANWTEPIQHPFYIGIHVCPQLSFILVVLDDGDPVSNDGKYLNWSALVGSEASSV